MWALPLYQMICQQWHIHPSRRKINYHIWRKVNLLEWDRYTLKFETNFMPSFFGLFCDLAPNQNLANVIYFCGLYFMPGGNPFANSGHGQRGLWLSCQDRCNRRQIAPPHRKNTIDQKAASLRNFGHFRGGAFKKIRLGLCHHPIPSFPDVFFQSFLRSDFS